MFSKNFFLFFFKKEKQILASIPQYGYFCEFATHTHNTYIELQTDIIGHQKEICNNHESH